MIGTEINMVKMYLVIKSRCGKTETHTAVWVDRDIAGMLLDRGNVTDATSVQFFETVEESVIGRKYYV